MDEDEEHDEEQDEEHGDERDEKHDDNEEWEQDKEVEEMMMGEMRTGHADCMDVKLAVVVAMVAVVVVEMGV